MGNALRREAAVYRASCAFSLTCNEGTSFVLKLYTNDTFVLMWERGTMPAPAADLQTITQLHSTVVPTHCSCLRFRRTLCDQSTRTCTSFHRPITARLSNQRHLPTAVACSS